MDRGRENRGEFDHAIKGYDNRDARSLELAESGLLSLSLFLFSCCVSFSLFLFTLFYLVHGKRVDGQKREADAAPARRYESRWPIVHIHETFCLSRCPLSREMLSLRKIAY